MAEKRIIYKIRDLGGIGEVHITEEVVTKIAALAAAETDGVASLAGNVTYDSMEKQSLKSLAKGIRVCVKDNEVSADITLNISYGKNILETSKAVQEKVRSSIENMTGLTVKDVNIHIAGVDIEKEEKGK
ncbi:MAG: Asp23/Gls24 family envelope stress response protein [Blautia sp.]|nr:Asp23/Gls24 family envelope stress response protein [Blautia sp.]